VHRPRFAGRRRRRRRTGETGGHERAVKILPGDYHITSFPAGNDAVIIFGVLHQESPESIQDIFRRAFEALTPGGVIYVLDMMTDSSHTSPPFSALFGLNMALTTLNGWVFSDEELRAGCRRRVSWVRGAAIASSHASLAGHSVETITANQMTRRYKLL